MHFAVYLPLLVPVLAALAARPLAARLPPVAATWLLVLSARRARAREQRGARPAGADRADPHPAGGLARPRCQAGCSASYDPASVPVAIVAGALLAAAVTGSGRALWRRVAALVAASRAAHLLRGSGQVVVIDDEAADAYTLPGLPCRIVITAGMLRALSPPGTRGTGGARTRPRFGPALSLYRPGAGWLPLPTLF